MATEHALSWALAIAGDANAPLFADLAAVSNGHRPLLVLLTRICSRHSEHSDPEVSERRLRTLSNEALLLPVVASALQSAEALLHIPRLIDPAEIAAGTLDKRAVLLFLSVMRRAAQRLKRQSVALYPDAAATKIQARFRGWRIRRQYPVLSFHKIHDSVRGKPDQNVVVSVRLQDSHGEPVRDAAASDFLCRVEWETSQHRGTAQRISAPALCEAALLQDSTLGVYQLTVSVPVPPAALPAGQAAHRLFFHINGMPSTTISTHLQMEIEPCAAKSSVSGEALGGGIAGVQRTLTVLIADNAGTPLTGCIPHINVFFGPLGVQPTRVDCAAELDGGKYLFVVLPSAPGPHQLEICVGSENIPGSPFSVDVEPPARSRILTSESLDSDDLMQEQAAVLIQAVYRGHRARQQQQQLRQPKASSSRSDADRAVLQPTPIITPAEPLSGAFSMMLPLPAIAPIALLSTPTTVLAGDCLQLPLTFFRQEFSALPPPDLHSLELLFQPQQGEHAPLAVPFSVHDKTSVAARLEATAPLDAGVYTCSLRTSSGVHASGSPFGFRVLEGADPLRCTASGPGLQSAIVGLPSDFILDVCDRRGEPTVLPPSAICAVLVAHEPKTTPIVCEITPYDSEPGCYFVSYTVKDCGPHSLAVILRGVHIPGSPFLLTVVPPPDPSQCELVRIPDTAVANSTIILSVQLRNYIASPLEGAGGLIEVLLQHRESPSTPSVGAGLSIPEPDPLQMVRVPNISVAAMGSGMYSVGVSVPMQAAEVVVDVRVCRQRIQNGLGAFLVMPRADPSRSRADGAGLVGAVVGEPASFVVSLCDSTRTPVLFARQQLQVNLLPPATPGRPRPPALLVQIVDRGDGSFTVTYTPQTSGEHNLSVLVNGVQLSHTPTVVPVVTREQQRQQQERRIWDAILSKPSASRVGDKFVMLLHALASDGAPVLGSAAEIEAEIVSPAGAVISGAVENGSEPGTYDIVTVPVEAGTHTVSVRVSGIHVTGSPTTIAVRSAAAASSSRAEVDNQISFTIGEQTLLRIEANDDAGRPVDGAAADISARLLAQESLAVLGEANVRAESQIGVYTAAVTPTEAVCFPLWAAAQGSFEAQLHVRISGKAVPGSPWSVRVSAARMVSCRAFGVPLYRSVVEAGEEMLINLLCADVQTGERVVASELSVEAMMMQTALPVQAQIIRSSSGSAAVSCVPASAGVLTLFLSVVGCSRPIGKFAVRVAGSRADASYCVCSGEGAFRCVAGMPATFLVTAYDRFGNLCRHGGHQFQVSVQGGTATIRDHNDGTYSVQYAVEAGADTQPGRTLTVSVTLAGAPVAVAVPALFEEAEQLRDDLRSVCPEVWISGRSLGSDTSALAALLEQIESALARSAASRVVGTPLNVLAARRAELRECLVSGSSPRVVVESIDQWFGRAKSLRHDLQRLRAQVRLQGASAQVIPPLLAQQAIAGGPTSSRAADLVATSCPECLSQFAVSAALAAHLPASWPQKQPLPTPALLLNNPRVSALNKLGPGAPDSPRRQGATKT
eukprot:TRINITY_DN12160_c0_g1_i1.p1 TRINITY_DN12160_c0_g1~~TRINITY_DN12160_c0_g1_i1.p1  ORF type:complete len:1622 (-),score=323.46 TRINITY_DN12160_c0_g1_i1:13-4593(-)